MAGKSILAEILGDESPEAQREKKRRIRHEKVDPSSSPQKKKMRVTRGVSVFQEEKQPDSVHEVEQKWTESDLRKAVKAAIVEATRAAAPENISFERMAEDAQSKYMAQAVATDTLKQALRSAVATGERVHRGMGLERDPAKRKSKLLTAVSADREGRTVAKSLVSLAVDTAEEYQQFLKSQEDTRRKERESVERERLRDEEMRPSVEEIALDDDEEMRGSSVIPPASTFTPALLECGLPVEVSGDLLLRVCDLQHLPSLLSEDLLLPRRKEYWNVGEVRRHWLLRNHCEWLLLPATYPTLCLDSEYAKYLWQQHTSDMRPNQQFLDEERRVMFAALRDLALNAPQPQQLFLCAQLMKATRRDALGRADTIRRLGRFFAAQRALLVVSLERLRLDHREATVLLRDLGAATGGRLRRLYLWHFLRRPAIRKKAPCSVYNLERRRRKRTVAPLAATLALPLFSALTVLSCNYCYLSDSGGEALLTLASIRAGVLRQLLLLVDADEGPTRARPGTYVGPCKCKCCDPVAPDVCCDRACAGPYRHAIPDWVWRRVRALCPALRVHLVLCGMATYNSVASLLSRSLPLAELHLSTGIDLEFQQPWLFDCIFRDLRQWYSTTLEYLSLHLWRNRDNLDSDLLNAQNDFPLIALEFRGLFNDLETMRKLCERAAIERGPQCGAARLSRLHLRPQTQTLRCGDEDLRRFCEQLQLEFQPRLKLKGIHLHVEPAHA